VAILLAVATAALSCTGSGPAAVDRRTLDAPRIEGPVRTDGTQLVDASGRPVRLFGLQVGGMATGVGLPESVDRGPGACGGWSPPPPQAFDRIETWGFNSVRLAISWANLEPQAPIRTRNGRWQHHYNQPYLETLDGVVRQFTSRGIAVVIEMAQNHWSPAITGVSTARGTSRCRGVGMPVWLYRPGTTEIEAERSFYADQGGVQELYAAAWRVVAARFASNPMVIGFDMMNEPYTQGALSPTELHLDALYTRVGAAIRSVDRSALLIFQDSNYAPGQPFALESPPPFPNVMYELHLYESSWRPDGLAKVRAYLDRATRWGVPLFIGEFDAFGYASPLGYRSTWQRDLRQMMLFCKAHRISWSEFAYAPGWVVDRRTGWPKPGLLATLRVGI
jgi:hypothetical protein